MNILIVDDEAAERRNLLNVLKNVVPQAEVTSAINAATAVDCIEEKQYDIAFIDVEMPGRDGIQLAKEIKEMSPLTNIVMVTAYDQYAVEAHRLFVSGYILKPATEEEVDKVMKNLRRPVDVTPPGLFIRCFGNFEVFYNGEIVHFHRTRAKEMLAYLVDRRGAGVSGEELRAILWEDAAEDTERQRDYLQKIWYDLRNTLNDLGCGDIVTHGHNAFAVNFSKVQSDFYDAIKRKGGKLSGYTGEYMSQYSWAQDSDIYSMDY